MKLKIIKPENLKITFNMSLGIIKLYYKTVENIHINILKIDIIENLHMIDEAITINTEKEKFEYIFDKKEQAYEKFSILYKKYINYYSIQIDGKDLLLEDLRENDNSITSQKNK